MFQKILIPFDFSPSSQAGFEQACALAAPDAELCLVHVVDEAIPLPYSGVFRIDELLATSRQRLAEVAAAAPKHLRITTSVVSGWIWRAVLDQAQNMAADSIVLGSHGRKGPMRFLLGSVAERLIRESALPVCVVKEGGGIARQIRRIGFATDLTRTSRKARRWALELARRFSASLHVIHVFEDVGTHFFADAVPAAIAGESLEKYRKFREGEIHKLAGDLQREGLEVREVLAAGAAPERIAASAQENQLDLVVMGTHGWKGLDLFFLGSVAAHTVRLCQAPVLVVKDSRPDA